MATILPYKNKSPKIASDAFVAENAVIIGDVEIGSQTSVWYGCVIRGDVNYIRIGEGTNIQDGTIIHVNRNNGPTVIGKNVTVGHKVLLHACVLEDSSFVGMGAKVMDFAHVHTNSMVGAGALVTPGKIVSEGELWKGVPAQFSRKLKDEEIEHINISASNYINLGSEYLGVA